MTPELAELARLPLERAFNAALQADPVSREAFQRLAGRRIRIELKGLLTLDLLPVQEGIVLAGAGIEPPDACLSATPLGFVRARLRGDLIHGDIMLSGDPQLTVRVARLLGQLNPDLERALTPHVGPLLAHQLGRLWQALRAELGRQAAHRLQDTADALRDGASLTPYRAELEGWLDEVDALRARLEALEARLAALEARPAASAAA